MLRNVDTEDEENHVHTNINTKNLSVKLIGVATRPHHPITGLRRT